MVTKTVVTIWQLELHLHDQTLGEVPLICGCCCVCGLMHYKPFWKHHTKLATLAREKDQTTTLGTLYPTLCK